LCRLRKGKAWGRVSEKRNSRSLPQHDFANKKD
jgi:hypothetical protein